MIDEEDTVEEIRFLKELNNKCPHIIEYVDDFVYFGVKRCIITEYCSNGDLDEIIDDFKSRNQTIPVNQLIFWNWDLLGGIVFLHSKKIIHRDIKPKLGLLLIIIIIIFDLD
jgi:serine/threonine protein kinase